MGKENLSEYTDRSEPIEPTEIDPAAIAERLGVSLIGGDQGRISPPAHLRVIGVCAACGMVITSSTVVRCSLEGCPSGLKSSSDDAVGEYDAYGDLGNYGS